jgi:hypothetical protein
MSFISLFLFLIVIILSPTSFVLIESCEIFDLFINEEESFDTYAGIIPPEIQDKIRICLFGDGNLIEEFGVVD